MKTVDETMLLADAYADCGRASPFAVGYKAERDTTRAALVRAVSELVAMRDELRALVANVHKAKGRYHSQIAMAALYKACDLPFAEAVSGGKA